MAHTGNFALIQTPMMAGLMASQYRIAKDAGWMAPALLANEMNTRSGLPEATNQIRNYGNQLAILVESPAAQLSSKLKPRGMRQGVNLR